MKKLALVCTVLILASLSVTGWAQQGAEEPRVVGVLMYADWCPLCKALEPTLDEVKREFQDEPILFTRFDLTDEYTVSQSAKYAAVLGLDDLFARNGNDTGYMELLEWPSRRVVGTLHSQMSADEIRQALDGALGN